jgi:hypothetical protein
MVGQPASQPASQPVSQSASGLQGAPPHWRVALCEEFGLLSFPYHESTTAKSERVNVLCVVPHLTGADVLIVSSRSTEARESEIQLLGVFLVLATFVGSDFLVSFLSLLV